VSSRNTPLPPELLNNDPAGFAWGVWHDRTPKLIQQIKDTNAYGPDQLRSLDLLLEEIQSGVMAPLDASSADREAWAEWGNEYFGKPWSQAPFLWSESYFYRRLLQAVAYFGPGPWRGMDPFAPLKEAELRDPALQSGLESLHEMQSRPVQVLGQLKLLAALWGNRADLGFRIQIASDTAAAADAAADDQVIHDDSADLWKHLSADVNLIVVADNAGRELIADLLFMDHLLEQDLAGSISLHLKPHPYYVSDATPADLMSCLRRLTDAGAAAAAASQRLRAAMAVGRLTLDVNDFSCAPWSYHRMPASLRRAFEHASIVVMKGDLNYRRLVGDRHWPPTTPFEDVTGYFPAPVVALRTLKSDVVVGLEPNLLGRLDATAPSWRTNGRFSLIQANTR
jgi:Damage-control phosphatase ARMT1-like domain